MSAVGRTFTKLRNQVIALGDICDRLESTKAPVSLVDVVDEHQATIEDLLLAVAEVRATLDSDTGTDQKQEAACFTFRSGDLTFHHVPSFLNVERLDTGRFRVTNLVPGESYLTLPPRMIVVGNDCNDGALCTAIVWTPSMTRDSFEVRFMYNGGLYDGNYGGSAPLDFLTFLLYPRPATLA